MGCWQIGGPAIKNGKVDGWSSVNEAYVEEILGRALINGISFFDTAPTYGRNNRSEALLGKYLPKKASIKICTKFGWKADNSDNFHKDFSVSNLHRSIDNSLNCLRTHKIDTLLLHGFPDNEIFEDTLYYALEDLRHQGVIEHWGVSPSTFSQVKICLDNRLGDTIEWVYHLLDRRIQSIFKELEEKNIRIIARSPFASGLIKDWNSDNKKNEKIASDDYSFHLSTEVIDWYKKNVKLIENSDESINLIALRFFLDKPIFKVVPGIRKLNHLDLIQVALQKGPLSVNEVENYLHNLPESYPSFK